MSMDPRVEEMLVSAEDIARFTGVSIVTIRRWIRCITLRPAAKRLRSPSGLGALTAVYDRWTVVELLSRHDIWREGDQKRRQHGSRREALIG